MAIGPIGVVGSVQQLWLMTPGFAPAIGIDYSVAETPVSVLMPYSDRVSEGILT